MGKMKPSTTGAPDVWLLLLAAWIVALGSSLSALYIGEILGQTPCVLCWFQRACMFPLAIILAVACYLSDGGVWRYALPVTAVGWVIALWHTLLFTGVIPPDLQQCGAGPSCSSATQTILGGVPIPVLSLIAFSAVGASLLMIRKKVVQ